MLVRPVQPDDYAAWRPLYDGYNAFYGREGATALSDERVGRVWARFFDPTEPVFALVAEQDRRLLGLTHDLFHRSVLHLKDMCYLQDLFKRPEARGRGVGQALIEGVYARAAEAGCPRVYWQTQESNLPGRRLYDQVAQHRGFIVYTHELER